MIFDILLHRVPWSGDIIRLYRRAVNPADRFIGEYRLRISGGDIRVLDNSGRTWIRRDLPKWSARFGCWEYIYDA